MQFGKVMVIPLVGVIGFTSIFTTGCNDVTLNPYVINDDTPYYKDIKDDSDNPIYEKVYEGEDGAKTSITRKTVELPDKKIQLEKDLGYNRLVKLMENTGVREDGDTMENVYKASYTDFNGQNITSMVLTPDERVLATNINYTDSKTLKMSLKNVNEDESSVDLDKENLTVYFYDASGSTVAVWQPMEFITSIGDGEKLTLEVGEMVNLNIKMPVFSYVNYMSMTFKEKRYEDYFKNLATYISQSESSGEGGEESNEEVINKAILQ